MEPTRRQFLGMALALGAALTLSPRRVLALASSEMRAVGLHNVHTGEAGHFVYYDQGAYVPQALEAMNHLLRDWRTDDRHPIDPALFDMLSLLQSETGSRQAYEIISAYRSPATNKMLFETTEGVNPNSLHMQGRALDIRLPDISLRALHDRAAKLQMGGVGLYAHSDFVHLDTGEVKRW